MPVSALTTEDFKPKNLKAARRHFESKVPLTAKEFDQLSAELKQRAFTIAKVNNARVIQRARNIVAKALDGQATYREVRIQLQKLLNVKDLAPGILQRIGIVYRQNALQAFSVARRKAMEHPDVRGVFQFWRYMTVGNGTPGVGGVRAEHARLHGQVFHIDDPIWKVIYPPWGWNCRCFVIPLTERLVKSQGLKVQNGGKFGVAPEEDVKSPSSLFDQQQFDLSGLDPDLREKLKTLFAELKPMASSKRLELFLVQADAVRVAFAEEQGAATRILLVPDGVVRSVQGDFVLDAEAAKQVIGQFLAHGVDVPVDWEHQTLGESYSSPDGRAPAAGWIKGIVYEKGTGLIGLVEWTRKAADAIAENSYRYLSPVLVLRKKTKKVIALHSVALTNKPAIVGMQPVTAVFSAHGVLGDFKMADIPSGGDQPAVEQSTAEDWLVKLRELLEIESEDPAAILEEVWNELQAAKPEDGSGGETAEVAASARKLLGLKADAKKGDVVAAINELTVGGTQSVPRADYVVLSEKVDGLAAENKRMRETHNVSTAETEIAAFKEQGKLTGALAALKLKRLTASAGDAERFDAELAAFKEEMELSPVVIPQGRTQGPDGPVSGETADRKTLILSASRMYDAGKSDGTVKLSTRAAWINDDLKRAGLGLLTKEEKGKYETVHG